jgi:hypothetical protein
MATSIGKKPSFVYKQLLMIIEKTDRFEKVAILAQLIYAICFSVITKN